VQEGIVKEKSALEAFPEIEAAARVLGNDDLRVGLAHQRGSSIAARQVPLAEIPREITAITQVVGDGTRSGRQRVIIVTNAVCGRRQPR
jgi:hypothetical protein